MDSEKLTFRDYIKSLQIVYVALIIGPVLFALMSFLLQLKGFGTVSYETHVLMIIIIPIFLFAGVVGSYIIPKKKLKDCIDKPTLKEKLNAYRSVLIIKYAFIEGSSFLAIVAYLVSGDLIFLFLTVFLLLIFLAYMPLKMNIHMDLELNYDEIQLINNPNSEIN